MILIREVDFNKSKEMVFGFSLSYRFGELCGLVFHPKGYQSDT